MWFYQEVGALHLFSLKFSKKQIFHLPSIIFSKENVKNKYPNFNF
jgi:hypothetical protein